MRWILGALVLLVLAIALDLGLLAYAMYALLGVILASRMLADSWSAQLYASRDLNRDQVQIGDTVAVVVRLKNRSGWPIPWLLLEDLLPRRALIHQPPDLEVIGRRLKLISFRRQAEKTIPYQLRCHRRGYYQLGPLVAETGDVFGLYRRYRVLSEPVFLQVSPQVVPLMGFDIASRRPIGEVRMSHRLFEDPTRVAGVRQYQAGDPFNRIHWRATAATGTLHSKVYEPSSIAGATLVLDFHERSFDPGHEPVRSELAVTMTASIAAAICEMGQQVGLVTNGRDAADRVRARGWHHEPFSSRNRAQATGMLDDSDRLRPQLVPTMRSNAQLKRILDVLARVEQTDGLTLAQLLSETSGRIPQSATVIAVLTNVTAESAVALGNLRRRGYAVVAVMNVFEHYEFEEAAAPLAGQHIETRHLRDKESIPTVCANCLVR